MWVKSFFDKTDVPAAFHTCESDFREVVGVCFKAHVLLQIVDRDMVSAHHLKIAFAVAHNGVRPAFDQSPEPVGVVGQMCKQAVDQD